MEAVMNAAGLSVDGFGKERSDTASGPPRRSVRRSAVENRYVPPRMTATKAIPPPTHSPHGFATCSNEALRGIAFLFYRAAKKEAYHPIAGEPKKTTNMAPAPKNVPNGNSKSRPL